MTHKNQLKRKIVFIGDSIINGFPLKRSLCFVSLFRGLTGHEVINKGENGETSAVILARFEEDALAHKPHSIAIHAGGNDLFLGHNISRVFDNLIIMAELALQHDIRPVLLTPLPIDPDLAAKRWAPNEHYPEMASNLTLLSNSLINLSKSTEADLSVIDLHNFYAALFTPETAETWLSDGLHPTERGHAALAEYMSEQARAGLL